MYHGGTQIWRFHTGLCKFLRNISTNICSLGKRTGLKLVLCLISLTSITSQFRSFLHWIVFDLFFYCVTVKTIYTLCLSSQILHNYCSQFLLGFRMVPRENKNNAYAKIGGTNKEYYGIFRNGQLASLFLIKANQSTTKSCVTSESQRYK